MAFRADATVITEALARLVRINSINPAFTDGATTERAVMALATELLRAEGLAVSQFEPAPGRVSVVGRLPGTAQGRSLLLYAHLDTVGVEGMDDPFGAAVHDGRLYGRGAYDMKNGFAAALGAVRALREAGVQLAGDLLVAGVADEEVASLGMIDVLRHVHPDAAIVTEPTELALCLAHKGFAWIEVETRGRAAHGSRFDEGVDANLHIGRVLTRLAALEAALRTGPAHPLVGPPSLHAATLAGGTGWSTYADRAVLRIERRMLPAERAEAAEAEIREIVDALGKDDPRFQGSVRLKLARGGFELSRDAPVARAVRNAATAVLGMPPHEIGVAYWMDAALLAEAGVETAVIGAAGSGAHAAVEWVDLHSVTQLAEILARAAAEVCGPSV